MVFCHATSAKGKLSLYVSTRILLVRVMLILQGHKRHLAPFQELKTTRRNLQSM